LNTRKPSNDAAIASNAIHGTREAHVVDVPDDEFRTFAGESFGLGLPRGGGQARKVRHRKRDTPLGPYDLPRHAARRLEPGAEDLVPADDLVEAPPVHCRVERPAQPEGIGDVIGGARGIDLMDEP